MLNGKRIICAAGLAAAAAIVAGCRSTKTEAPSKKPGKLTILSDRDVIPPPYRTPLAAVGRPADSQVAPAPQIIPREGQAADIPGGQGDPVFLTVPVTEPPSITDIGTPSDPTFGTPEVVSPKPSSGKSSSGKAAAQRRTYKVQKGDSLSVIAYMYEVPWRDLAAENDMTEKSVLQEGKTIYLPAGAAREPRPRPNRKPAPRATGSAASPAKPSQAPAKAAAIPADGVYTSVKGDNLWIIAKRFNLKRSDIIAWNPNVNFEPLQVNQKILLKGGASAPQTAVQKPAPKEDAPVPPAPPATPAPPEPQAANEAPAVPPAPPALPEAPAESKEVPAGVTVPEIPDGTLPPPPPAAPTAPEIPAE